MNVETRYYRCPNCQRAPHVKWTEEIGDKEIEFECEYCLHPIVVDQHTPQTKPDTHPIYRE